MDYTLAEIVNHKTNILNLSNNLFNTADINQEITLNEELIKQAQFLLKLLNIKKNLIFGQNFQNNNMNNIFNPMQNNPMNMFNNINNNLFQQMMNQNIITPLNFSFNQGMMGNMMCNAGPLLSKSKSGYNNITNIKVIFEENNSEINNEINQTPIVIECSLKDKISQLIEKYYEKIGNNSHNKKFLFCNFELSPDLTLEKSLLFDGCKIKVVNA